MDPLSIRASILAILNLTRNAFSLASRFHKAALKDDNRFNTMYFRLMAENQNTITWANRMRSIPVDDLQQKFPLVNFQDVKKIIEKFQKIYNIAENKFRGFQIDEADRYNLQARQPYKEGTAAELGV